MLLHTGTTLLNPLNPHSWYDAIASRFERSIQRVFENAMLGDFGRRLLPGLVAAKLDEIAQSRADKAAGEVELAKVKGKTEDGICADYGFRRTRGTDGKHFLECTACKDHPPLALAARRAGGDSTRGELGVITAGQDIVDLRRTVSRHLMSKGHVEACGRRARTQLQARAKHTAGMVVGRTALFRIQENLSHMAFERTLLLNSLNGVDIGQLNHSTEFSSAMNTCVCDALKATMRIYFDTEHDVLGGRRVPLSVSADKATNDHRTGQVGRPELQRPPRHCVEAAVLRLRLLVCPPSSYVVRCASLRVTNVP